MQLYGRFLLSNLPLDLRYYKCHMPDGLSQTLDKRLPLNKQFAFPGNVTSDSHVNGAALGSSTAALVHWRPVRNCPSSASFAWESIEGPWTEHNISYKAFKPGLGPGWAREESRCEQTPSDRDSESSNGPCGSTDLVDGEDLTHQQLPRL